LTGRQPKQRARCVTLFVDSHYLYPIDGKLWIQRDGTEHGIAKELLQAGVSKDQIVLAFKPPEVRRLTDSAVA
jgi:hypothetical protein